MQLTQIEEARMSAEAMAAEEQRRIDAARYAEKQWAAEEDRIAEKRKKQRKQRKQMSITVLLLHIPKVMTSRF